jgi:hypothetical protein
MRDDRRIASHIAGRRNECRLLHQQPGRHQAFITRKRARAAHAMTAIAPLTADNEARLTQAALAMTAACAMIGASRATLPAGAMSADWSTNSQADTRRSSHGNAHARRTP